MWDVLLPEATQRAPQSCTVAVGKASLSCIWHSLDHSFVSLDALVCCDLAFAFVIRNERIFPPPPREINT